MLVLDGATLTYEAFADKCLKPNRLAVVKNAADAFSVNFTLHRELTGCIHDPGIVSPLQLMQQWIRAQTLQRAFADLACKTCPVYVSCSDAGMEDGAVVVCKTISLADVFETWCDAENTAAPFQSPSKVYLKDWHFQQDVESVLAPRIPSQQLASSAWEQPAMYGIPRFLGTDVMHAYHLHCRTSNSADGLPPRAFGDGTSDYRFLYAGIEGTWTPLHRDVFATFSWSLNVRGRKLWYFFSDVSQAHAEAVLFHTPAAVLPVDMRVMSEVELFSFYQEEGDLVFVPSGWYHQVHNVDGVPLDGVGLQTSSVCQPRVVVSINHNWMSFEQLPKMFALLHDEVAYLLRAIGDDTRAVFSQDELKVLVDKMLMGSSSWDTDVMRSFLNFVSGGEMDRHLRHDAVGENSDAAACDVAQAACAGMLQPHVSQCRDEVCKLCYAVLAAVNEKLSLI